MVSRALSAVGFEMAEGYLKIVSLIERLHRYILEVVKAELDRLRYHDINNVQAIMLFNIGDSEMTIGEITTRGCYLGSNVSYNVGKMVENGYLIQERSTHDRRMVRVRLSRQGRQLKDQLSDLHSEVAGELTEFNVGETDLQQALITLERLERLLMNAANRPMRGGQNVA